MKTKDLFIIGLVLFAATLIYVLLMPGKTAAEPTYAVIYVGDEVYERVALDDYRTVTVDQGDGRVNVIRIDEKGIWMESSTCKNQICVHHAPLDPDNTDVLDWIVCLPNGVSIELESEG